MKIVNARNLSLQEDLTTEDLERFQRSAIVAVDTETTGLNPHRDVVCMVQLCDRHGYVNIIRASDWTKSYVLRKLLEDQSITKVFHYALFDCSMLLHNLNVEVANPYCTKIASKIARTYTSEHSLNSLVKELFEIELDKSQQSTDWLREQISQKQLEYAANDVAWLIELKTILDRMLVRRGLLPTGITFTDLNERCQQFIPTLVHLWVNGWNFGTEDRASIFSH